MFFTAFTLLLCLVRAVPTYALWTAKTVGNDDSLLAPKDFGIKNRADGCGGEKGLSQCGSGFPLDFCCTKGTVCMALNSTSTITAALCCPAGQDCSTISPVSCDQTFQDATNSPGSQLHSDPTVELDVCGDACCPMGYSCSGTLCVAVTGREMAQSSPTASSGRTLSPSKSATLHAPDPSDSTITSATPSTTLAEAAPATARPSETDNNSHDFSGKSFTVGFIPGIIVGMLLLAALFFYLRRRKQKDRGSHSEKKHHPKENLTDLDPRGAALRPTVHGRSISEPTVDASLGYRTDFVNRTLPEQQLKGPGPGISGHVFNVESPTPRPANPTPTPQAKGWLSRSPFVNQVATPKPVHSPLPPHGTPSFEALETCPARGIKKQRSMHLPRRQSQQAPKAHLHGAQIPHPTPQQSTEMIIIEIKTAGQFQSTVASYRPYFAQLRQTDSSKSWQTTFSVRNQDTTSIEREPGCSIPTRPGRSSKISSIGASPHSQYSPSNNSPSVCDNRASTRTQPQVTYPPIKASSALQPYPATQLSETHKSFVAPVGHASTFADTGMPFLKSPNLRPPSPVSVPTRMKGNSRLTGLFPNQGFAGDYGSTRSSGATTWGGMIEKAGLRRSQLYTSEQGDPRQWNRK